MHTNKRNFFRFMHLRRITPKNAFICVHSRAFAFSFDLKIPK